MGEGGGSVGCWRRTVGFWSSSTKRRREGGNAVWVGVGRLGGWFPNSKGNEGGVRDRQDEGAKWVKLEGRMRSQGLGLPKTDMDCRLFWTSGVRPGQGLVSRGRTLAYSLWLCRWLAISVALLHLELLQYMHVYRMLSRYTHTPSFSLLPFHLILIRVLSLPPSLGPFAAESTSSFKHLVLTQNPHTTSYPFFPDPSRRSRLWHWISCYPPSSFGASTALGAIRV